MREKKNLSLFVYMFCSCDSVSMSVQNYFISLFSFFDESYFRDDYALLSLPESEWDLYCFMLRRLGFFLSISCLDGSLLIFFRSP